MSSRSPTSESRDALPPRNAGRQRVGEAKGPRAARRSHDAVARAVDAILVVEDDPISREAMERVLSRIGARIYCAASAAAAWECYQRIHPKLIVSDITLGEGETGLCLMTRIRAEEAQGQGPVTTAIAITGLEGSAIREEARRAGFDHFLAKPVDLRNLATLAETSLTGQI